jgi:hypothetical protein
MTRRPFLMTDKHREILTALLFAILAGPLASDLWTIMRQATFPASPREGKIRARVERNSPRLLRVDFGGIAG